MLSSLSNFWTNKIQDNEGLIIELRKELRVSDDEHKGLLLRVNNDDVIRRIRYESMIIIAFL